MAGGDASYCRKALNDLNECRHRFNNKYTYEEVNITDPNDLFEFFIRSERRRELAGDRMHRWCDFLRRYGMPEISHSFSRRLSGNKTEAGLQKNRYVLIDAEEVDRLNPRLKRNK